MNQTCDRCGPAVRAAYRVDRGGELYADAASARSGWRCPCKAGPSGPLAGRSRRVPRASSLQVRSEPGDPTPAEPGDWHGGRACRRTRAERCGVEGDGTGLAHAAPAASAADTGIDLIAESISLGSHDGDSLSPARPWDR